MATSGRVSSASDETALAIAGHVDRKAGFAQPLGDEVGDGGVVFDDQGSHG